MTPKTKAIVTIVVGPYAERMAEATNPFMQDYARRCDAEFVIIREPKFQYLGKLYYEKFQLHALLESYERILYVDNDVLISPDSPDLFQLTPIAQFGVSSEETWSRVAECKDAIFKELGVVPWEYSYFNAGVMLASQAHREVFDPSYPKLGRWANDQVRKKYPYQGDDQTYFNYRVNELQTPVLDHGYRFNHTRSIAQTQTRFRSFFIHYAGPSGHRYGDRLAQIEKDTHILWSPWQLWLSRQFPAWRWIADRFDTDFVKYLFKERLAKK